MKIRYKETKFRDITPRWVNIKLLKLIHEDVYVAVRRMRSTIYKSTGNAVWLPVKHYVEAKV